ncbi:MAG: hypothetical protein Q8P30_00950 [Candidatus Uhrbacteria bacterium]|nr:hypothetical protein [Candidatus Uhrbacteria bacterium]
MKSCEGFRGPIIENEKSREREVSQAFFGSILKWTKALLDNQIPEMKEATSKMSKSLEIGSAMAPALLFSILTGCNKYEILECTESEGDYIEAMVNWLVEHPQDVQNSMNELWPDATVSANDVIDVVATANIECGVQTRGDHAQAGEADKRANRIIVDVNTDLFTYSLDDFEKNRWVQDYTIDELVSINSSDDYEANALVNYNLAIAANTEVLAHEAAHFVIGLHNDTASDEVEKLNNVPDQQDAIARIDEIYGWGVAANKAGIDFAKAQRNYFH